VTALYKESKWSDAFGVLDPIGMFLQDVVCHIRWRVPEQQAKLIDVFWTV
jgi:hypothetical protein